MFGRVKDRPKPRALKPGEHPDCPGLVEHCTTPYPEDPAATEIETYRPMTGSWLVHGKDD